MGLPGHTNFVRMSKSNVWVQSTPTAIKQYPLKNLDVDLCMYTCMHINVYILVYIYTHTYICMYICTYVHTYIYTYIYTYMYIYIYVYMYIYIHTDSGGCAVPATSRVE